ncbi:MAG: cyp, cytochrome p460 [Deltaproteobacteria bacterium CSP1-8]|nr:MAG: cyp, cytochrome p460 [Deltaproteobacteria bacterium CSP1-8]
MRSFAPLAVRFLGVFLLALAQLLPIPANAGSDLASPMFGVTIPEGYRNWPVVASSHRTDKDEIRVILGNDIAMKAYRAGTLPFPDGSILAKLAWKRVKSAEFETAFVPGEPQRIEFMVKNAKKYASTGGWGFGRFVNGKPADETQHGTCFPCHQSLVKGNDFVFTRYAP